MIAPGSRVRLLDPYDAVYPRAFVGSEGDVAYSEKDEYGFERIYVVWDKEHPRYNGERDMWTFANHFDVIEQPDRSVVEEIVDNAMNKKTETCPSCGQAHDPKGDRINEYLEILGSGHEKAATGQGFFIATVNDDGQGAKVYIYADSFDDKTAGIIEAHIADYVVGAHKLRIVEDLNESGRKASEG